MKWKNPLKLILAGVSILFFDFMSKGMINFFLPPLAHASPYFPFDGKAIFQNFLGIDFCIHHVTNRGAAWGVGDGFQNFLLVLRIGVVIGLFVYMLRSSKAYIYRYPITMILAGGVGNIIDYFIYGHVIDMFHFIFWGYSYPVFNVADASIFLGIVWLLSHSFIKRKKHVLVKN